MRRTSCRVAPLTTPHTRHPTPDTHMKFHLIWPRSTADAELAAVADRYLNRIKHFFPIEIVEIGAAAR